MNILVTGGTGYIGSHTLVSLYEAGHTAVVVDNLVNSSEESLRRVETITGQTIPFHCVDLRDRNALDAIFSEHALDGVIHFAGLKAVGESVQKPLEYYDNNIGGSVTLLEVMREHNVDKLIFSSSATVYGTAPIPYVETEQTGVGITNPYGQTKFMIEQIMKDTAASSAALQFVALRYFNPIGAHPSGSIGEDPQGIPNNLMPFITQTAIGRREKLQIFGDNYDTPDGTCVRDYIHVMDLARGHVAALEHLKPGFDAINLGSGRGVSVLELVNAFQDATGVNVPYEIAPRRDGDLPEFYADATKAASVLGWHTELTAQQACEDTWKWQTQNPSGYSQS